MLKKAFSFFVLKNKIIERKNMKKIKKHDNITVFILLFIISIVKLFSNVITPFDHLWVFGNTYKLSSGHQIYQDVNIIDTPIFFKLGEYVLKIFSANYMVFLIFGAIIITLFYLLIYVIFKQTKMNKKMSLFYTLLILGVTISTLPCSTNYITLSLVFYEIGIISLLKGKNKNSLVQAMIISLTFFTYQKIGIAYLITYFFAELFTNKNKKTTIVNIIKTAINTLIIAAMFLIYEYISGNLINFLDLCIIGISEFKTNLSIEPNSLFSTLLIYSLTIGIYIYLLKKYPKILNKKTIDILIISALGTITIIIPIVNQYHIKLSLVFFLIAMFYETNCSIKEIIQDEKINKIFNCAIITFYLILLIKPIEYIDYTKTVYEKNGIFKGALFYSEIYETKKNVNNYIKKKQNENNNIRMLSIYSMCYTLENNIENGYLDMPLTGNMGKNGNQKLIDEIKTMPENTLLLVENEERSEYQLSQFTNDVRIFVQNNYNKVDSIENFDVYKIKN